ncbi:uncharacterized protein Z520_04283 [Fonsecaea multimorphosa CBS 102226]|uniref:Cupin type-2 domain-containing protein n=1 Tax=Fonsecaea multimorphosa CBS 102226 TaxID=1442371 RepID=A0A0D2KSF5_9EURO|nr:uncharacterized protein Z520_04283 [Fonsecaea multimorphosa CBS 102226]KIX99648.1 hypothetical protein Z520_04283 [Fonsecaea multimorphosa CBS 102226]OAL26700.1 hypothetical protein AYO22_04053 [Fonsecaea multimorphosa]
MSLPVDKGSHEELANAALKVQTKPLWTVMAQMNPPTPKAICSPCVWRYDEIRPCLQWAGELVTGQEAERRTLMLVNPTRDPPYTTDTLSAGLQLVMPKEVTPAHRHTAFAMRFIIEGQDGFTTIRASRIRMQRGDLVLNPTWNWHDQGTDGDKPIIWLDGLDVPTFRHFPAHFVEQYPSDTYPQGDAVDDSPNLHPWEDMQKKLDKSLGDWTSEDYLRPDGKPVSKTLGGAAERLNAGCTSPTVRETASSVYHVVSGQGYSDIDGARFHWKQGDTFCVPAWNEYKHTAEGTDPVYLYRFHDKPMLTALGIYRVDGCDLESLVSE